MPKLQQYYEIDHKNWKLPNNKAKLNKNNLGKESIRQWLLKELIDTYLFPNDWVSERIVYSEEDQKLVELDIFGFYLTLEDRKPFIFVCIDGKNGKTGAEERYRNAMLNYDYVSIGIFSDGTEKGTIFTRRVFGTDKFEYISDIEEFQYNPHAPGNEPFRLAMEGEDIRNAVVPLTSRIDNIFLEVHNAIRDIDGLHADQALDELCKIIYTKYFDEEISSDKGPLKLQTKVYGTNEELAAQARSLYNQANEYDIRVFKLKIPNYERSRGVFNSPILLSSPAITKVVEILQGYSLTKSKADVKGRAFQKVLSPTIRSGMGQYFTPDPIVQLMVNIAQPSMKYLILDPFCGSAHFLSKCLNYVRKELENKNTKQFHEFAFGKLHGIEKSERMVRIAMTDMRLQGDGHSNIRCTDSLLDFSNYPDLDAESFDLILTNPPFGSLIRSESIVNMGTFELAKGKKNVPLEIIGLERCLQFLRPGGTLGIVVPDSLLTNQGTKYVREWIEHKAKVSVIISLPIETFCPFGANIKTSIMFMRKWEHGENRSKKYKVKLVRIDSVGYDMNGRANSKSEISEVEESIHEFINNNGW